jgi:uncharacterized protein (DUF2235 family)
MKRLVLCCDGTWNRADQEDAGKPCPTNVIKIAYRLCKKDPAGVEQIIYYDQGVGTGDFEDKLLGGATGAGLEGNIHDAYIFLIANYEPGDDIYLIGFSRGAFTARSIGGMIRKCGIVKRTSVERYHEAIDMYHDATIHPDDARAVDFRAQYSLVDPVPIKMVGVWDTVGALGIPLRGLRAANREKYEFHDTELSGIVQWAFHALAIDEHRTPFEPTLWLNKPKPGQTVEQVWFPGVHSDIGGGYGQHELSDGALDWMMRCGERAGLAFDKGVTDTHPLTTDPAGTIHDSMTVVYRVEGVYERPIAPDTDATQSIHPSAIQRWDRVNTYRPKNLREYFKRVGDPRANQP